VIPDISCTDNGSRFLLDLAVGGVDKCRPVFPGSNSSHACMSPSPDFTECSFERSSSECLERSTSLIDPSTEVVDDADEADDWLSKDDSDWDAESCQACRRSAVVRPLLLPLVVADLSLPLLLEAGDLPIPLLPEVVDLPVLLLLEVVDLPVPLLLEAADLVS
jgi:hypothetical protein